MNVRATRVALLTGASSTSRSLLTRRPCDVAMAQVELQIAAAASVLRVSLYFYSLRCF